MLGSSIEQQWLRVTGSVQDATRRAASVADNHRLATQKLDAAEYALGELFDELSSVMKVQRLRDASSSALAFRPLAVASGLTGHRLAA